MEKIIVTCQHCHAKYKVVQKGDQPHIREALCPNCGFGFTMWMSDDYYQQNFPKEIATYIHHEKRKGHAPKITHDLRRIEAMRTWLTEKNQTFASAKTEDVQAYCADVRHNKTAEEAEEIASTLGHFFDVLVRKGCLAASPFCRESVPQNAASLESVPHSEDGAGTEDGEDRPVGDMSPNVAPVKSGHWRALIVGVLLVATLCGWLLFSRHQKQEEILRLEIAKMQDVEVQRQAQAKAEIAQRQAQEVKHQQVQESEIRADEERIKVEKLKQLAVEQARLNGEQQRRLELKAAADRTIEQMILKQSADLQANIKAQIQEQAAKATKRSGCVGDCEDGQGTYSYPNGDRYEGAWKHGQRWGEGTLFLKNGDSWTGSWREDKRLGAGRKHLVFADYLAKQAEQKAKAELALERERKLANWRERAARGNGASATAGELTTIRAKGTTGCVQGDCQDGEGVYVFANGDIYKGFWAQGNKHGYGTYSFKSGSEYSGNWQNDKKHGQGTYTFKDGQSYSGDWSDDQKHGWGIVTFPNGRKVRTKWSFGKRVS